MQYIFASDPHGIGDPWINLVTLAEEKYPNAQLVFGGDYIDGHPYSLQIVKFIRQKVQQDHAIALIGNHEQRMYEFVTKGDPTWYFKGGEETARTWLRASLSKKKIRCSLQENPYYSFLINLPTMYVTKHLVFVHAGLTKGELAGRIHLQSYKNIHVDPYVRTHLWVRTNYIWENDQTTFAHNLTGKTIVTGHVPTNRIHGIFSPSTTNYSDNMTIDNPNKVDCPVKVIQYPNEAPRYFTDNGCHKNANQHGNICVFNDYGQLIQAF